MSADNLLNKIQNLFNGDIMAAAFEDGVFVVEVVDFDDEVHYYTVCVGEDGMPHDLRILSNWQEIPMRTPEMWVSVLNDNCVGYHWSKVRATWAEIALEPTVVS